MSEGHARQAKAGIRDVDSPKRDLKRRVDVMEIEIKRGMEEEAGNILSVFISAKHGTLQTHMVLGIRDVFSRIASHLITFRHIWKGFFE